MVLSSFHSCCIAQPVASPTHWLICLSGTNDGLISTESARGPEGEFLGVISGVDQCVIIIPASRFLTRTLSASSISMMAPANVLPMLRYLEAVETGEMVYTEEVKNDVVTVGIRRLKDALFWKRNAITLLSRAIRMVRNA